MWKQNKHRSYEQVFGIVPKDKDAELGMTIYSKLEPEVPFYNKKK